MSLFLVTDVPDCLLQRLDKFLDYVIICLEYQIPLGDQGSRATSQGGVAFYMARVIGFVDGFNLYHSLVQLDQHGNQPYAKYRWLDYWSLVQCFVGSHDTLEAVYYFTAYVEWDKAKKRRHLDFVSVQRDRGVTVVLGKFRLVQRTCRICKQIFDTYEEKRTDVNIAITMLQLAFANAYDKAILISADSDLIPAIEAVKSIRPSIKITVVVPLGRKAKALSSVSDYFKHLKVSHLKRSLLPSIVTLSNGRQVKCPAGWL